MAELSLSPDVQKRLSEFAPISPKGEFVYVPKAFRERGEDGNFVVHQSLWPQFRCRELKSHEILEAPLVSEDSEDVAQQIGRWTLFCVKRGLLGWKNWKGEDGKPVEFFKKYRPANGVLSDDALDIIPAALIYEIGTAIASAQRLSDEELRGLGL